MTYGIRTPADFAFVVESQPTVTMGTFVSPAVRLRVRKEKLSPEEISPRRGFVTSHSIQELRNGGGTLKYDR